METPSARVMKEGRYRLGFSQIDPYRYYYGAISLYSGFEIDGRVTEILGVPGLTENYGNDKDKAIDFKYQFISEGMYRPAVAVGIMDPHGTRKYASQYIVASKQIYPFDFSIGAGNGRFGKNPLPSSGESFKIELLTSPGQWLSDAQLFGGVQFAVSEHVMLMAEYNPIKYNEQTSDTAQPRYFQEPVSSKFNFGLRWKPYDWAEIDLTYQRGNQIGANVSIAFDLGSPFIPIYEHPYREPEQYRSNPVKDRIVRALHDSGFGSIGVILDDSEIRIEAQNDRYFYNMNAIGVALKAITLILPERIETVRFVLKENGIPMIEFVTTRTDLLIYGRRELTVNEFFSLAEIHTDVTDTLKTRIEHRDYVDVGLKPALQMFLNDPSGFFKYRLGVEGWVALHPRQGSSFVAGAEGYPVNNISTSNVPSDTPVRTDNVPYLQKNIALGKLLYDQVGKYNHEIYGRITGGILETEYAGLDAEVAKPILGGRLMLGLSGSLVRKRDPDSPLALKENDWKDYYKTAFVNTRLNIPEYDTTIELNSGQFLAGDRGTRITVSKSFNGVILSAWYSITDTSVFTNDYNQGYHDKGIAISIPIRLFKGADSRTSYGTGISPWTRDVAQDIRHYNPLFDFIGRNTEVYMKKDKNLLQ